MNILVLRYRFIGDTILTVPFLRNLRRAHPGARIDLMVAPYSSDVLRGIPYVDEFIVYDPPTIHADSGGRHRTFLSKIRFVADLRSRRYDKAYVLKRSFSSAAIAFLSGARERIGFDTERRGFLLTKRVPYRQDQHEVRNFLDVLKADGVATPDDHLEAWISPEEGAAAEAFLAERGVAAGERVVAIHPFSANQIRAWHEDGFVAVANALQERLGVRILLLGGRRDREMAAGIAEKVRPAPVSAVGGTDLRQSMALLSKCALLICNDSGIMHLAAALDLPLIALFGPQSPVKFGPWGKRCRVLYKRFPCSPCRQRFFEECDPSPRGKPMCMETIAVDEVIGEAQAALEGTAPS
ncbi:MAG TPA: lipopolysaccharide heptosyltransferase II [Candidatus Deferrimicrobiaceae bacterium]